MKFFLVFSIVFTLFFSCSKKDENLGEDADTIKDDVIYEIEENEDFEERKDFEQSDSLNDDEQKEENEQNENEFEFPDNETTDDDVLESTFDDTKIEWLEEKATVSFLGENLRTYTLSTTASLRDDFPPSKKRVVSEKGGNMILRSGNTMFDALFAMSLEEVEQNSVSKISDWSFNNGNPVDCNCFETGELWNYVWTRDTSYAVDLGLALIDPERAKNSLLFKISEKKDSVGGGNLQIIQDTGSGGSWPVSTDRVSWVLGAIETLKYLDESSYSNFLNISVGAK
ncbi:MAG: hypothetical protein ACOX2F_01230 [bacterium]